MHIKQNIYKSLSLLASIADPFPVSNKHDHIDSLFILTPSIISHTIPKNHIQIILYIYIPFGYLT